ncbi:nitrile hydratase subunit alpha [uncultured Roseobacter sp.]|uniref:nitrile hydratase subunit alpha n=1 Tax=uncultured Roseobacter sp. TaxID=114847 RepID=UPI0026187222|nr:nitrile hydratase subunit alpha [uncultured Roseobacter sp.]
MHDHDHDHHHEEKGMALRVKALEQILSEKGLIDTDAVDAFVELYEKKIGPKNGASVVARAWTDPDFKARLLENGTAAVAEMGFSGLQGENFVVLENTAEVHNVVVCTLCSCYPWPVLGLPPRWYKDAPYRSRVVKNPREVLAEFGTVLPDDKKIKVWDSSAEIRYMVLPERPDGTESKSEAELADIVTRDSMIGVTQL